MIHATARRRILAAVVTCVAIAPAVFADTFLGYQYAETGRSDLQSADAGSALKTSEHRLAAGVTGMRAGSLDVDVGLDYQYTRYEYTNVQGRNRDLHRLQLPVGLAHRSNRWQTIAFIAPGVAASSNVTDDVIENATSDDYFVTGAVEAAVRAGATTEWLFGARYDQGFGTATLYPVFGVRYQPSQQLSVRLALPDTHIEYAPSSRQQWALRVYPAGAEWHVVSDELDDEFVYETEAWRAQGTYGWNAFGPLWLDVSLGYEFARHHDFIDDRGAGIDSDADADFLVAVGFRFGAAPIPYANSVVR